jgi:small subunit ribosomal protein S20
MASNATAKKRIRQIERRTVVNRSRVSRIRTYVRRVEDAISEGDKVNAQAALTAAQPEMMRGVTKGVAHRNTVARRISRLSARIKAMEG